MIKCSKSEVKTSPKGSPTKEYVLYMIQGRLPQREEFLRNYVEVVGSLRKVALNSSFHFPLSLYNSSIYPIIL